jgi:hypothetical protein
VGFRGVQSHLGELHHILQIRQANSYSQITPRMARNEVTRTCEILGFDTITFRTRRYDPCIVSVPYPRIERTGCLGASIGDADARLLGES